MRGDGSGWPRRQRIVLPVVREEGYILADNMFDEPNEEPMERSFDPADRAREKSDEFRMHAELVAVFEGCRKFDAEIRAGLDAQQLARMARRVTVGFGGAAKLFSATVFVAEMGGHRWPSG